jgi:hypothetical protein
MICLILAAAAVIPTAADVRKSSDGLVREWAAAQHRGDAKTYLSFYDTKRFHGTKRTTSGEKKEYNFTTWSADRTKLLKNNPEVAVDDLKIVTWLDGRTKLKPGIVHITFTQRWRSPRYADHGPKIMQLYVGPDGKPHIIYEALLQSRPGWDKPAGARVALTMPKNDDEALALWRKLNPTGKNWESVLSTVEDVPQLRRALARALLGRVDFECKDIVNEGNCGEDDYRWGPLPDDATVDNPCLARQLAIWSLNEAKLGTADLKTLWPKLEPAFGWKTVDENLCDAIVDAPSINDELQADVIAVAIDKKCGADRALKVLPSLSEKARVDLADRGVEAAFDSLDPKKHYKLFVEGLGQGSVDFRIKLIDRVKTARVSNELKAKLREVVKDEDERLSAVAADALANLGDQSFLPRRPSGDKQNDFERELRRLYHDPDSSRANERLRAFLPKKGRLKIVTTTRTEYDGNTPPEEREEEREDKDYADYDTVGLATLKDWIEPDPNGTVNLVWKTLGGKLYLVGMEIEIRRFVGCPC